MMDQGAREILRARLRMLDLAKSFFASAPDAARIGRWRGILPALGRERISPALDAAVLDLATLLSRDTAADLGTEYHALFVDPFAQQPVELCLSHYRDGRLHGPSLAAARDLFARAGLVSEEAGPLAEDHLALLLDAYAALLGQEAEGRGEAAALAAELLLDFLLPLARAVHGDLAAHPRARFFRACAGFIQAYLELEALDREGEDRQAPPG